TEIPQK
ncbi:hypothetical protein ECFRIK1997_5879, partial [Escherichia coli FRIK1997]